MAQSAVLNGIPSCFLFIELFLKIAFQVVSVGSLEMARSLSVAYTKVTLVFQVCAHLS